VAGSGVVEQGVETAVGRLHVREARGDGRRIGDVERLEVERDARGVGGGAQSVGTVQVAHGGDDGEAGAGRGDGRGQPDAGGGAGDEEDRLGHDVILPPTPA